MKYKFLANFVESFVQKAKANTTFNKKENFAIIFLIKKEKINIFCLTKLDIKRKK